MSVEQEIAVLYHPLREVSFVVWGVPPDPQDIREGEFPINDRLGQTKGLEAALGLAFGALQQDPGLLCVLVRPTMSIKYFQQLVINRPTDASEFHPKLDPQAGDDVKKGTIII